MKTYCKSDVETHREGYGGKGYPAVNVKVYRFPLTAKLAEALKVPDDSQLEQALTFAFESAQEQFWENAPETAKEIFGGHVKVYSAGRSGGWLIVQGLPDVDSWDAVAVARWRKFENLIKADVAELTCYECFLDAIESNEWVKPGAERYNFIDTKDGKAACIADLKAEAVKAGFGPVVRK